jgi:uncharacterized membrane protein YtjA (UPF0391 family)
MLHGNTAVVFMVIAVVSGVLGLAFAGLYYLNKAVNNAGRAGAP